MTKYKMTCVLACLFLCIMAASRPARIGIFTVHQPDGRSFSARCFGDEFMKIKTTLEGHAIVKDENGWWCYADFDSEGRKASSGYPIGSPAPADILNKSLNIPYLQMTAHAQKMRAAGSKEDMRPMLLRLSDAKGMQTKTEGNITKHGLIILAQYKDVAFEYDRSYFVDMLTKLDYDYNGADGSVKEYFDTQFGGKIDFQFDVSEIVTLPSNREYYGGNNRYGDDIRPAEMIRDACLLADDHIDFSQYDDDADGYVDNVFVFFAGRDEAETPEQEELIWSHSWYLESGARLPLTLDGINIDSYACTAELTHKGDEESLAGIGTFCHEYSHTLGLPDFYDTDYSDNGWAIGMWRTTSLMDGGNANNNSNTPPFFNCIERELLGIAEPAIIDEDGTYTLAPIHMNNGFYRINTATEGEYYLIEYRQETGWDSYIRGNGMLIYHIDRSKKYIRRWLSDNSVNAFADHQCADILEADGRHDIASSEYDYAAKVQNIKGIFFPNPNTEKIDFTPDVSMTNIKNEGDYIKFSIVGFSDDTTPPVAMNMKVEAFMDAAIINFESSREHSGDATIRWGRTDQEPDETVIKPYEPGKYAITLTGLTPGNKTYTASICFQVNGVYGENRTVSFMTSKKAPVEWPYIYVGRNKANDDGTFKKGTKIVLMVYNAVDAAEIRWTFNDKEIYPEGDGYFTVNGSGTLKAYVLWENGGEDIIEKKINVTNAE